MVVLSCDDGPWVVAAGGDTLFAFAAIASTITTGEFSADNDDDDAAAVLEDVVVVVVAAVVVADEISVEEKAVTFRTGISVVGETVDDVITMGGGVGNGATDDEDTIDPGTTPCCSVINCPWEGVAYPQTTLTYMSNVPQLFNLSSVPHSPVASQSSPRSTSRQFGNSVSVGQKALGSTSRQSSSHDAALEVKLAATDGIVVGGNTIVDIVGCSVVDAK